MPVETEDTFMGACTGGEPEICVNGCVRIAGSGKPTCECVCTCIRVSPSVCKQAGTSTNKDVSVSLQNCVQREMPASSAERACVRMCV